MRASNRQKEEKKKKKTGPITLLQVIGMDAHCPQQESNLQPRHDGDDTVLVTRSTIELWGQLTNLDPSWQGVTFEAVILETAMSATASSPLARAGHITDLFAAGRER